jgi:amidase
LAERMRIAVFTQSPLGGEVDAEVRATTLDAARRCETLGHVVEEIPCPYGEQIVDDTWIHISFIAWALRLSTRLRPGCDAAKLEPWTHALAELWKPQWPDFVGVARRLRATRHRSAQLFERYDLLLCPTLAELPPRIGEFAPDLPFELTFPREKHHIALTPIQNATGDPAISLPLGVGGNGLPIGVQASSAPGTEATLLSLAYALAGDDAFRMLA